MQESRILRDYHDVAIEKIDANCIFRLAMTILYCTNLFYLRTIGDR